MLYSRHSNPTLWEQFLEVSVVHISNSAEWPENYQIENLVFSPVLVNELDATSTHTRMKKRFLMGSFSSADSADIY